MTLCTLAPQVLPFLNTQLVDTS